MLSERLRGAARQLFVPPADPDERNIYFLYVEVIFAALLGAAGSFNSAYVLRLGGSNTLIGLLSSLPALLAIFLYIPSARFLERKTRYMPWVVGGLFVARLGYLPILILPFFLHQYLPELTVAILIAMAIPSIFFSTGWSPMLSDVIPARARSTVLAWRSILNSALVAPLIFLAGRWLDGAVFPLNYQLMYALGFASAGLCGVYLVARIKPGQEKPRPAAAQPASEPWWRSVVTLVRDSSGFGRIIRNTLLFNLGAWMVGPLYIIYYVRSLGATDGWVGLLGTVANIGVVGGYWVWRRIMRRQGEARTLLISLPLVVVHALLVALLPNLTLILAVELLINFVASGVNLSHSVIFLGLLPQEQKHTAVAVYSVVMNVGAFACPLLGVALSNWVGIVPTLLIGFGLRLAGALLFYVYPVRTPEPRLQPA